MKSDCVLYFVMQEEYLVTLVSTYSQDSQFSLVGVNQTICLDQWQRTRWEIGGLVVGIGVCFSLFVPVTFVVLYLFICCSRCLVVVVTLMMVFLAADLVYV